MDQVVASSRGQNVARTFNHPSGHLNRVDIVFLRRYYLNILKPSEKGARKMSETVAYARVSTREQNLDAQLDQLEKVGVAQIFKEKLSGVDTERPELKKMLDYVRSGDTVVATKIDRIARSVKHLLEIVDTLKAKGVHLNILNLGLDTNTPNGKMMLTVIGAIAEFERELMLERQKEGIEKAKQKGKYKGRKPTARAKAKQVMKMLDNGYKKTQIAEELNIGLASVYRIIADQQESV